jgi:hypothetical protein
MRSTSNELRGVSGQALAVVASTLLGCLEAIKSARESLLEAAGEERASRSAVKKRLTGGRRASEDLTGAKSAMALMQAGRPGFCHGGQRG